MSDRIRLEIKDGIAVITMDSPPVNAQDEQFRGILTEILDRISEMDEVRSAILTGAGKVFSAGANIKIRSAPDPTPGARLRSSRVSRECFHAVRECAKPIIAAVNGPALGAGLALAASCDILVTADTGSFGLPEIDVGLLGGASHAMRLFGHSILRRMMLTGYRVPGPELLRLGIVEACVPGDQLMEAAMSLARNIADKSPVATRLAKWSLNTIEELSLRDGYRFEQNMTELMLTFDDLREAMLAFLEKRAPVYKGK